MTDIKIFQLSGDRVTELEGQTMAVEKSLQVKMERHLDAFLGVTFLASEYSTGKTHGGRIDTLGIDENRCPVIIEYKRSSHETVINQGLFYLDWLLDHKAEFELLTLKQLGQEVSERIEWSSPRLICIAGDFTKYDVHAVQQINRNIELMRYRGYGDELLLLELVNAVSANGTPAIETAPKSVYVDKTATEQLDNADPATTELFETTRDYLLSLGDDVQLKTLKLYFAFRRIKNFACIEVSASRKLLRLYVKVNPETVALEEGFTRDVSSIGHWGTGDLEITLRSPADLEKAKPLLEKSYEAS